MPGGDRTGPRGLGSMTGRGAGYCAGFRMPGFAGNLFGRGAGMGAGRAGVCGGGWGWRNWFHATGLPGWMRFGGYAAPYANPDPGREKQALNNQAETLQKDLDSIRKRLEEMETGADAR